jgi:NAD(P)-dependent dehydrogenase (short-subunit alcohol dehydrogenase family)
MEALNDQIALITGAAGGIGRAIATSLARAGVRICLLGRTREALEEVARGISGRSWVIPCDLADDSQVRSLPHKVLREAGPIDLLIHSAAVYFQEPLETAPV